MVPLSSESSVRTWEGTTRPDSSTTTALSGSWTASVRLAVCFASELLVIVSAAAAEKVARVNKDELLPV